MGWLDKVVSWGKRACEATVTTAKKVANAVGNGLSKAGEYLSNIGKAKPAPKIDYDPPKTDTTNEEKKKAEALREAEAIAKFQSDVQKQANEREIVIKKEFIRTYNEFIPAFAEILDEELLNSIKGCIRRNSKKFTNFLRDKVNTRVSPSYQQWKDLVSKHPSNSQLQSYCDRVYKDADDELLDLLQETINETNAFISKCVNKYNEDRAKALADMKDSLVNLTSDEETKAQELKKIAEELAVVSFIAHEASKNI